MKQQIAKVSQFNTMGTVHYKIEHHSEGVSRIHINIDWEKAPEPDHSYIADYFELHVADSDVVMVFGKLDAPTGQGALRNKIEIYFPHSAFVQQLWRSSRTFHEGLRKRLAEKGREPRSEGKLKAGPEAKIQTLAANNALIVMSTGQCVLDFFLIPAKDVWIKTQKGLPLNILAIVRVFLSEPLLLGFLDKCDEIAQELKRDTEILGLEEDDEVVEPIDA